MQVLPPFLAYGLADLLTPILVITTYCGRRRATRKRRGFYFNVEIVFRGALTGSQRRRLLWRWARHMTNLGIDVVRMPLIRKGDGRCDVSELDRVRPLLDADAGALVPSGHIGIYELLPIMAGLEGYPLLSPYRQSPIPIVTDIINELRRSPSGVKVTESVGAVRHMLRALKRGEILGIISDVSSKTSEVFAPFLGTMAATNSTCGVLHLKTGAPIVVTSSQRIRRGRYKLHVWDVIENYSTGDRQTDIETISARINACLTEAIVTYPEQWFWDARRFRNRPADEVLDEAGLPPRIDDSPATRLLAKL